LIVAALIVPGAALALRVGVSATELGGAGAPGGATMASATRLYPQSSNRGTVDEKTQQIWYELYSEKGERALFQVWGPTRSCPVRVALLDARGRTLGQIVSSSREIEPFLVLFPAHPASDVYYLRIDADPYRSCASASYTVILLEPEQAGSCDGPPRPPFPDGEPDSGCPYSQEVPKYENVRCDSAGPAYSRDRKAAEEAARRHLGIQIRRRLESYERAALREMIANCPGVA